MSSTNSKIAMTKLLGCNAFSSARKPQVSMVKRMRTQGNRHDQNVLGRWRHRNSRDCLQPLLLHQRQKFERRALGILFPALPLAHKAWRYVEVGCKDRLTCVLSLAQCTNPAGRHFLNGRETQDIELPHGL